MKNYQEPNNSQEKKRSIFNFFWGSLQNKDDVLEGTLYDSDG